MLQKSARLQYALLALVAFFALTHVYLGAVNNFQNLASGHVRARLPFFGGFLGRTLSIVMPEAKTAGLQAGDTILTINGQRFTGTAVLLAQVRQSQPHQPLTVTYLPHG